MRACRGSERLVCGVLGWGEGGLEEGETLTLTLPPLLALTCALWASVFVNWVLAGSVHAPPLSVCLSVSLALAVCLSLSLTVCLSLSTPSLSPSLCGCLSLSLPHSLADSLSGCLSGCLSLSPPAPSLSLSGSLSPLPPPLSC